MIFVHFWVSTNFGGKLGLDFLLPNIAYKMRQWISEFPHFNGIDGQKHGKSKVFKESINKQGLAILVDISDIGSRNTYNFIQYYLLWQNLNQNIYINICFNPFE